MVILTHSLFHCHWSWRRMKATAVLEAFALVTSSLWEVADHLVDTYPSNMTAVCGLCCWAPTRSAVTQSCPFMLNPVGKGANTACKLKAVVKDSKPASLRRRKVTKGMKLQAPSLA